MTSKPKIDAENPTARDYARMVFWVTLAKCVRLSKFLPDRWRRQFLERAGLTDKALDE
jgi:hypothetical protein